MSGLSSRFSLGAHKEVAADALSIMGGHAAPGHCLMEAVDVQVCVRDAAAVSMLTGVTSHLAPRICAVSDTKQMTTVSCLFPWCHACTLLLISSSSSFAPLQDYHCHRCTHECHPCKPSTIS